MYCVVLAISIGNDKIILHSHKKIQQNHHFDSLKTSLILQLR